MVLDLVILSCVAFVQNMAFTWSSRSRNSGDPRYHFKVAGLSNGIWFVCFTFIMKSLWDALLAGDILTVVIVGLDYTFFTSLGSAFMMKILLKKEKGKRQVGAK